MASTGLAAAFDLQGHRGARGLAPENTLAGFKVALDLGVSTLETDLAVTKANELVISHDPLLNPDLTREPDGQWLSRPGPAIRTGPASLNTPFEHVLARCRGWAGDDGSLPLAAWAAQAAGLPPARHPAHERHGDHDHRSDHDRDGARVRVWDNASDSVRGA